MLYDIILHSMAAFHTNYRPHVTCLNKRLSCFSGSPFSDPPLGRQWTKPVRFECALNLTHELWRC